MEKLLISIADSGKILDLGRTSINALIKTRRLDVVRIGRRTLITSESIHRLIAESAQSEGGTVRAQQR